MNLIILGLALPGVLYFIVRAAVKEGVSQALLEYDKYKNEK
ncbi:hypothetical protein [Crassaminicella profunda]|nr:hypothetical protein [Crassaminicella profunda]